MAKRIELADSGVIFNEENHTYLLGDKYLSGITGLLQRQLFPNEFDNVDETVLAKAAAYGTTVHHSCENFDANWINDGTPEVQDYIQIVTKNGLVHEASEYTVTDGVNYASNIDKVYRLSDNSFSIGDLKTYGNMSGEKIEKAKWQLSIYAALFELQNPKSKVEKLFIIHLRNKEKSNGEIDKHSELIPVERIPSDICFELLKADLEGRQFVNPFGIPDEIKSKEGEIRDLMLQKTLIEERLNKIKEKILNDMRAIDAKQWVTDTMKITRKLPFTRVSLDSKLLKSDFPEIDYSKYEKVSQVSDSLLITI